MSSSGKGGCLIFVFTITRIKIKIHFTVKLNDDAHMVPLLFRELSVGRGSTATLGGGAMPKIHTVEPWDGKDGQVSGSITMVSHSEKKTKSEIYNMQVWY